MVRPAGRDGPPFAADAMAAVTLDLALARLSAEEIVAALRLASAPAPARAAVRAAFAAVSRPLGRVLARFDARIAEDGLARAAAAALEDLGARCTPAGPRPPARGPLLVVTNHPGAYDALALFAAIGRDDVAVVAFNRAFLRAMPHLAPHLLHVPEGPGATRAARARALRRAMDHAAAGGALLHFAAGCIEPDPAFPVPAGADRLAPWQPGAGRLVRALSAAAGSVVAALVQGVHSGRAKAHPIVRLAESHGVTTIAPLLQVAFARYREVAAVVRFAGAERAAELASGRDDAAITAALRERALGLWPARPLEHVAELAGGAAPLA